MHNQRDVIRCDQVWKHSFSVIWSSKGHYGSLWLKIDWAVWNGKELLPHRTEVAKPRSTCRTWNPPTLLRTSAQIDIEIDSSKANAAMAFQESLRCCSALDCRMMSNPSTKTSSVLATAKQSSLPGLPWARWFSCYLWLKRCCMSGCKMLQIPTFSSSKVTASTDLFSLAEAQ